jgi:hypothetical protein
MESLFKFLVGTLEEKVVVENVDPLDEEAATKRRRRSTRVRVEREWRWP